LGIVHAPLLTVGAGLTGHASKEGGMLTQHDIYEIATNNPEMARAFYKAVKAIIELREEAARNKSGLWATARLKKRNLMQYS
jgi:hypothetical protein